MVGGVRKNSLSPMQYTRKIEKIFIHEQFDSEYLLNDIALAKVDAPFLYNAYSGEACLPETEAFDPKPGFNCFAAGWGNMGENKNPAEHLQEAQIPILDKCSKGYNDVKLQICGGYARGGIDSCQGKEF